MYFGLFVILLLVGLLAYVRLAPHNVMRWHHAASGAALGATPLDGGFIWREDVGAAGPARLARLDGVIRASPRTQVLAGSVEDRQLTYVSRTRWMGFPDYTTVTLDDGILEIYGRLRFGRSDMGVNAKRIRGWLDQL
ncbi:hypothetical protein FIU94_13130 [Sulfitobacter sp. THAF37]|uniref:DUF1499 domain-containing protein n=1 Tax=Sulfitobacter sp. THAF37 TaxID=2587855 RepID=UPI0012693DE4|nr:DUF1499 domain-containing protein [Sulfitobacter sp. THAF37]QFT59770.1 hypothetical protein FIU94_13130 [Sulfitobacter sp. THAF37]